MGVDKANIRSVVHYDLPSSVEAFLQESGRAGRDRQAAQSVVLWNATDRRRETDRARAARELVMRAYLTTPGCRRSFLMEALGSESEMCFGCDRCGGTTGPIASTQIACDHLRSSVVAFVRRNRRRFTPRQLVERLAEETTAGWSSSATQELIASLMARGLVRVPARGPWKNRVSPGRTSV
jgi:ATP-dependent DNA helicase RecQ